MDFRIEEVSGIGDYEEKDLLENKKDVEQKKREKIYCIPNGKAFCIKREKTIELRTDKNLSRLLREKYESVMVSRYFGNGGIEIVLSGQITLEELYDMVRLSFNLTKNLE